MNTWWLMSYIYVMFTIELHRSLKHLNFCFRQLLLLDEPFHWRNSGYFVLFYLMNSLLILYERLYTNIIFNYGVNIKMVKSVSNKIPLRNIEIIVKRGVKEREKLLHLLKSCKWHKVTSSIFSTITLRSVTWGEEEGGLGISEWNLGPRVHVKGQCDSVRRGKTVDV